MTSLLPLLLLRRRRRLSTAQRKSAKGTRVAEGTSTVGARKLLKHYSKDHNLQQNIYIIIPKIYSLEDKSLNKIILIRA